MCPGAYVFTLRQYSHLSPPPILRGYFSINHHLSCITQSPHRRISSQLCLVCTSTYPLLFLLPNGPSLIYRRVTPDGGYSGRGTHYLALDWGFVVPNLRNVVFHVILIDYPGNPPKFLTLFICPTSTLCWIDHNRLRPGIRAMARAVPPCQWRTSRRILRAQLACLTSWP